MFKYQFKVLIYNRRYLNLNLGEGGGAEGPQVLSFSKVELFVLIKICKVYCMKEETRRRC